MNVTFPKAVCLVSVLGIIMCSCTPTTQPQSSSHSMSNVEQSEPSSVDYPVGTLRFVTDDNLFTMKYVGNSQGYYYIDKGGSIAANLRYIDYASAQDVYLSSRPEGNHFVPEDESYISSVAGYGTVFPVDNTLYLMRTGAPNYADQYGQDALAAIFTMGLDGSDRNLLYMGGAEEKLLSTVAVDDENLYLISDIMEEENNIPVQKRYLIRINRDTGEKTTLCELTSSSWMIGVCENYLVFHSIYQYDITESNAPSIDHEIFVYDFDTQKLSVIKSWPADRMMVAQTYEDKLITADIAAKTINVQKLTTGEYIHTFSMEDQVPADGSAIWFFDCIDGKFVFWNWLQETLWGIDLETGEWTAVTLTYQDPEKMEARPVEVYAETETDFLVCRNKEYALRKYSTWEGDVDKSEALQTVFALISKEDYWNSIPNFRDVIWND